MNHLENTSKENGETPTSDLFKANPSKHYYVEGRKAELGLLYLHAAEMYTKAYFEAMKAKKSSAIFYKWYAMRCIEYDAILTKLMSQVNAVNKCGRTLSDGSIMVSWTYDTCAIDKEIINRYKQRVPPGFYYNVVIWNPKAETMRFIHSKDFYGSSEPRIDKEFIVNKFNIGYEVDSPADRRVILHKWMLVMPTSHNQQDRHAQMRRSVKIEFLKLPAFMKLSEFPNEKFWDTYIEPAIGNRNIGLLEKKYSDYLVSLTGSGRNCANSSHGVYDRENWCC